MTTTRVYPTRHDLPSGTREQMVALLNQQLADAFDLYSQTKQAHWNVKGRDFYQLHELFDELAEAMRGYIDMLAERATALGGEARGTARMAAAASRLPEYPSDLTDELQHVRSLADRYANLAATTRTAITTAMEAGDQATADLLSDICRGLDKHLWFLEAHLQER